MIMRKIIKYARKIKKREDILYIVVPCYNEEQVLAENIQTIKGKM